MQVQRVVKEANVAQALSPIEKRPRNKRDRKREITE